MNHYFGQLANVLWSKKSSNKSEKGGRLKRPMRRRLALENLEERALLAVDAGFAMAALTDPASTEYIVTTLADTTNASDGVLSLREAIAAAGEGDTITFAASLKDGTITLSGTELKISKGITIDASSIGGMTIDANRKSRVFYVSGGTETNSVQLVGLTIQKGKESEGGGIYNDGLLTMTNCVISMNSAACDGGGIYNNGVLTLTNCIVSGNSATFNNVDDGGGIGSFGTLTLKNSIISVNYASFGDSNIDGTYTSSYSYVSNIDPGFVCAPIFDNSGVLTNAAALDFHLKSSSWLINSGDNSAVSVKGDLEGNPRIYDGVVDLGAYEYQQSISEREAVSLVVTTEEDSFDSTDGQTSLREAIYNARTGETITFAASLAGKIITLCGGELIVDKGITIDATSIGGITIDANQKSRVFYVNGGTEANPVQLIGLTVQNGKVSVLGYGGGIYNSGNLTLMNCVVSGNSAEYRYGGGIYNSGMLTLTNCNVSGNSAKDCYGGGIYNEGTVTLTNSTVLGNSAAGCGGGIYNSGTVTLMNCDISENSAGYGGGIYNDKGIFILTNSTITRNSPGFEGGGIYNSGSLTLTNCTITENSSSGEGGGGIYNICGALILTNCTITGNSTTGYVGGGGINNCCGTMTITNCIITENSSTSCGGGIYHEGTVTLTNCTVAGNSAEYGGGIFNKWDTMTLINCTVSGNSANKGGGIYNSDNELKLTNCDVSGNSAKYGGGIYNYYDLTLTNCTVSGNSSEYGGGIYNNYGTLNSYNSIIALNTASSSGSDIVRYNSYVTINGYNTLSSWTSWDTGSGNLEYDSSLPLFTDAEHGDYTLCNKSQAIDKGNNEYVTTETDLAGEDRIYNEIVDLGAYEYQGYNIGVKVIGYDAYYDGQYHSVTLKGLQEGDKVSYSRNGITFREAPITFYDTGERLVYVKVEREGCEAWIGKGKVKINAVPLTISGTTISVKEYDGTTTAVINPGQLVGFMAGEKLKVAASGEFPSAEAGEYDVMVSYTIMGPTSRNYIAPESELVYGKIVGERLDAPENICLVNDSYGITMSWDVVENADKYYVYYGTSKAKVQENVIETTAASWIFDQLDPENQTYYFSVKAVNTQGLYYESELSDVKENFTFNFSLDTLSPGKVIRAQLTSANAKVSYAWYRISEDGEETFISQTDRYKIKTTDVGCSFRCEATGKLGSTGISAVKTSNPVALPGTQIAAIKKNGADVTVAWYAVADADSYTLYYSQDKEFSTSESVSLAVCDLQTSETAGQITVTETKTVLNNLDFGATYYLRVQARDSTGAAPDSAISDARSVTINKIATPEITSLTTVGNTITVDWKLVEGANRYVIQYSTSGDFSGAKNKIIDSTTTSNVTLTELTAGSIYYVRVQARDTQGVYTSSEYSVRRIQANRLETPVISSLTVSGTSATLEWSAIANANKYVIFYATNPEFTSKRTKGVLSAGSLTITNLKAGETYYFKIQARDTSGKFVTSDDSEVMSAAISSASLLPDAFDDNDAFDFIDDEILSAFAEEPELLDVF